MALARTSKKRQRVSEMLNSDDSRGEVEQRSAPHKAKNPKSPRRSVRELREIAGRLGKGPISYVGESHEFRAHLTGNKRLCGTHHDTADGNSSELNSYVSFEMGVLGGMEKRPRFLSP